MQAKIHKFKALELVKVENESNVHIFNIIDVKDMKYQIWKTKIILKEIRKSEYAYRSHPYDSLTFIYYFPFSLLALLLSLFDF